MRISVKCDYGLLAVMELAANYGGRYIPTAEIAERRGIPEPFLEQLLPALRKAGIVVSLRGPHGGSALAIHPSRITAGDVVRAMEGTMVVMQCPETGDSRKLAGKSVLKELWGEVRSAMEAVLDRTTIEDLVQRESNRKGTTMYYI